MGPRAERFAVGEGGTEEEKEEMEEKEEEMEEKEEMGAKERSFWL